MTGMVIEGGCYCGNVRYRAEGEPTMRAQCHCRECQYFTGGGPNFILMMPADGFTYTKGEVGSFTRSDLERPVTREFCPNCGAQIVSRVPGFPVAIVKVGTMDDPSQFGSPQLAIYTCDKQDFHEIADSVPQFEKMPG